MIMSRTIARQTATITFITNSGARYSGIIVSQGEKTFTLVNRKVSKDSKRFNHSDVKEIITSTPRRGVTLPHFNNLMRGII